MFSGVQTVTVTAIDNNNCLEKKVVCVPNFSSMLVFIFIICQQILAAVVTAVTKNLDGILKHTLKVIHVLNYSLVG